MNSYQFGQYIGAYKTLSQGLGVARSVYTTQGLLESVAIGAGVISVNPVATAIYGTAGFYTAGKAVYGLFKKS